MYRLLLLLIVSCLLISCPIKPVPPIAPVPVDPVPVDPVPVDPEPSPLPTEPLQQCKVEWGEGVTYNNYDALIRVVAAVISATEDTCTANTILCITIGNPGDPCYRVWKFENMDSIPRRTFKDECGNTVIHYLEQDL